MPRRRAAALSAPLALLAGAAAPSHAQPGFMHQRLIGEQQHEVLRDIVPTPLDSFAFLDHGSFAVGSVQQTPTAPSDLLLTRHRPDGSLIWSRRLDLLTNEHGYKAAIAPNGNYLGVMTLDAPAGLQTSLVEVTPGGAIVGVPRIYRGTGTAELVQDRDVGVSLRVIDGGDRMITANLVNAATQQGVLTRTDPTNAPIWTRRYSYPTEPQQNTFADVAMVPPASSTVTTYAAVGTIPDTAGIRRILVQRVDPAGLPIGAWAISLPTGQFGHLFGDGVAHIRGDDVVISGHLRPNLTVPNNAVAVTLRFNVATGTVVWSNFEQQFLPGRAAVDWRPEEGALVGGEWRRPVGTGFSLHPALMLTDGVGAPVSTVWHTNSVDARYDAATVFQGQFGKRIIAAGWGTFGAAGYGGIDALTSRTNSYGSTPGCPESSQVAGAPQGTFVRPLSAVSVLDTVSTFLQGTYGPIPLRDDSRCSADPCDPIDFNNDGLFPDTADLDDFLSVFSGGPCSTSLCKDIDFNNDGLFPDTADIDSILSVFSGGPCL
ncbi:MAG TPA: hypothetical protein VHN77_09375 [Phycisphaerales bacterium]|nr:hypothetical protein [Phycisphaerales bacterium]